MTGIGEAPPGDPLTKRNSQRRAPTLKTISEATGLAVTTVSRALKDGPELSAETRARVREVATQLGYRPHRAGVRLRTGRTFVVGDTPDDAVAARHVGAHPILYDGGSHHLPTLQGMGAPVAHTLVEAVEIARAI